MTSIIAFVSTPNLDEHSKRSFCIIQSAHREKKSSMVGEYEYKACLANEKKHGVCFVISMKWCPGREASVSTMAPPTTVLSFFPKLKKPRRLDRKVCSDAWVSSVISVSPKHEPRTGLSHWTNPWAGKVIECKNPACWILHWKCNWISKALTVSAFESAHRWQRISRGRVREPEVIACYR